MLSPSTAPRWNRHTSTLPRRCAAAASRANAARATNSGSRPKLMSASAPERRNARRVIPAYESVSMVCLLLLLELRAAETQAHRQRPRLARRQVGDLPLDDGLRALGHGSL